MAIGAAVLLTGTAFPLATVLAAGPATAASPTTLNVATSGTDSGNCQSAPCATLGYALSQAGAGDTIVIGPGTYKVSADPAGTSDAVPAALTGLTIESAAAAGGKASNTIFDVTGAIYGVLVNANGVTVNGLTFENPGAAGIQVSPPASATAPTDISGVTIENNVIENADQCQNAPDATGCAAAIGAGDYGESLWLMSATQSTVEGNTIENGLDGGMLVSDEMGPNFDNLIEGNNLQNNALGCGITLAAHNMNAVAPGPNGLQPNPAGGGVYNDTVENNVSDGAGANGIALFNFAYNNTIEGNTTVANGGPGIEIDDDIPKIADLNGNSVIGNTVEVNSLQGGPNGDTPGQHTVHTTQTAGVVVIAKGTPVKGTVIKNNTITGNYYGIWMSAATVNPVVSGNAISVSPGGSAVFVSPGAGTGYWLVGAGGGVFAYGSAPFKGSAGGQRLSSPLVGMAATPDRGGYWLAAANGRVYSYGDAINYGSVVGKANSPIVGIAASPDGGGYWLVDAGGQVFNLGDTLSAGSPGHLNQPVVGFALSPDSGGYWMVTRGGGVFSFGDAKFQGSATNAHLGSPVVGLSPTKDGGGYWLATSSGEVVAFGDAVSHGSAGRLNKPIVGISATPDGGGYWLAAGDGGVLTFGDATFYGSAGGRPLNAPVAGMFRT